jgi:hypothetical protein
MAATLQDLGSGAAIYYGNIAGIWVMLMHKPPLEMDMLLAKPSLNRMVKLAPQGFPSLTWIMPSAGFSLDPPTKKAAHSITGEFSKNILSRATLIDANGFQAAAVRALVTGVGIFTQSPNPGKVFTDLESAVAWSMRYHPNPPPVRAEFIVRTLRNQASRFQAMSELR